MKSRRPRFHIEKISHLMAIKRAYRVATGKNLPSRQTLIARGIIRSLGDGWYEVRK